VIIVFLLKLLMSPEKRKHIQLRHMRERYFLVNPLRQKSPIVAEKNMESLK